MVLGGGAAAVYGALPLINFYRFRNSQATVQQTYLDAETAGDRRAAAGQAADLRAQLVRDANAWNGAQGSLGSQYITYAGGAAAAVGVGVLVGGIILMSSSGDAPDEDDGGDDDDDRDNDKESNDDDEEVR